MPHVTCSIDGCEKKRSAKGYCPPHYQKFVKYGDPMAGRTYCSSPEEALETYSEWRGECLIWTGATNDDGYGTMRAFGKTDLSHRVAYIIAGGTIPDGYEIDHTCWNRACIFHEHLRLATDKQNMENQSGPHKSSGSGVRGVYWNKPNKKWIVQVRHNKKSHYFGSFTDLAEAERVAIEKRNELFTYNDSDRLSA